MGSSTGRKGGEDRMRPSRGMGDINPAKQPRTVKKRDGNLPVSLYAKGGVAKKKPRKVVPFK